MSSRGFTLLELIIVIIVIGILATLGIYQYSQTIEYSRFAEANITIGLMRKQVFAYYLKNNSMSGVQSGDILGQNVLNACSSTNFYTYQATPNATKPNWVDLSANRCTSGGKTPNASRHYIYGYVYDVGGSDSGSFWYCAYDDGTGCYGMPSYSGVPSGY